jgi:hypothetical protein
VNAADDAAAAAAATAAAAASAVVPRLRVVPVYAGGRWANCLIVQIKNMVRAPL